MKLQSSEADIKRQITDWLKAYRIPFRVIREGYYSLSGVPDIIAALPPQGRALYIEVKTEKEKVKWPTKNNKTAISQRKFKEDFEQAGAIYILASSSDDVEKELEKYWDRKLFN